MAADARDVPTSVSASTVTVRPGRPVYTTGGRWLVWLSLPWALAALFGLDAVLTWAGLPPGTRPFGVRLALLMAALTPVAVVMLSPLMLRLRGFDWLFARPQPLAVVDRDVLRLWLPRIGEVGLSWERVGSMTIRGRWNATSELRSPAGEVLAIVPDELVHPKVYWRTAFTLAESVVRTRPDRYALTPGFGLGRPSSFDLRERVGEGIDGVAWHRRQNRFVAFLLAGLLLLGAIPMILLMLPQDR